MDPYGVLRRDDSDGARLLHGLLERIPHEARSLWRAKKNGSVEKFGWDALEYIVTNLDDRIQGLHNMLAVQGSKKRPRAIVPAYRPGVGSVQVDKLEDFDFSGIE